MGRSPPGECAAPPPAKIAPWCAAARSRLGPGPGASPSASLGRQRSQDAFSPPQVVCKQLPNRAHRRAGRLDALRRRGLVLGAWRPEGLRCRVCWRWSLAFYRARAPRREVTSAGAAPRAGLRKAVGGWSWRGLQRQPPAAGPPKPCGRREWPTTANRGSEASPVQIVRGLVRCGGGIERTAAELGRGAGVQVEPQVVQLCLASRIARACTRANGSTRSNTPPPHTHTPPHTPHPRVPVDPRAASSRGQHRRPAPAASTSAQAPAGGAAPALGQ
jgi:hypothetical protein